MLLAGAAIDTSLGECPATLYDGTVTIGGTAFDTPWDMATGTDGSVGLVGTFYETVDFDPGEGVDDHTAYGTGGDVFITRFNPDRSYGWTRTFGSSVGDYGHGVDFDQDGRVIITGGFWETVDFDPGEGVDEHTSAGITDAFVTVFSADGSYEWTRVIGGTSSDGGHTMRVDGAGNIVVAGGFSQSADFDPDEQSEDIQESNGIHDVFVLKLTHDGDYVWAVTFGGAEVDTVTALSINADDDIVVTGSFRNTVDFDPSDGGVDEHTSNGASDVYVSKFNADGDHQWTATIGGTELDFGSAIAFDADGNVVVGGSFKETDDGPIDFDPTEGVDERSSNGGYDLFVTKLTGDGSYLWTWTGGSTDADQTAALTVDADGSILAAGNFGSDGNPAGYSVDFDPTGGDVHTTEGEQDVFFSHLLADGTYRWTQTFGGPQSDKPTAIALGLVDELFIAGWFDSTTDFDPSDGTDFHDTNGVEDIFLTTLHCTDDLPCDGDANGDGLVDPLDSGFVLSRFGCPVGTGDPSCDAADMNGDGLVDPLDAGYVLARFGTCD